MDEPTIGLILKGYPRISETFISNEILLLEQMGFRFHIFSMRKPRESFSHRSVSRIQATVDYLPETILQGLGLFLASGARLASSRPTSFRAAWRLVGRRFLRTRKSASIKHLLQAGYLVDRLLPRYPIDRFHAHFAHSPTSVAMYAGVLSGMPFGFTAHAKDIYTSDPFQLAEKIDRADVVVTCTEYNRSYLRRLPTSGSTPLFRVYHGIDLELFSTTDASRRPTRPYRVLTVARLTAKKGIHTVLSALDLLRSRGVAFRYTVIGDGEERDRLMRMADDLGLHERVTWMGTQPHDVVLNQYRNSDVFAIGCEVAANGDRDGIPNVLVESMAMEVPVVATRVSAIPELVEHESSGLLVEPGQPFAMAQAIQRILMDEALRFKLTATAKQVVFERFDNRKLIRNLAEIYRKNRGEEKRGKRIGSVAPMQPFINHESEKTMDLKTYFESNKGMGILSTADRDGKVNSAVYSRPHVMENGEIAFIMRERLTHRNILENPHAAYLFIEEGTGYKGKRFHLTKTHEESDTPLLQTLRRRTFPDDPKKEAEHRYLVFFRIDRELPLIGA